MLDFIKQGLTVSLFWHHWSARTNGCTAHKDPGCQGGVFGITTSGVRYYWSGVRCQLSVCLLVSFVVRKSRRTRVLRGTAGLKAVRSSPPVWRGPLTGEAHQR